jgi:hypothetical protein
MQTLYKSISINQKFPNPDNDCHYPWRRDRNLRRHGCGDIFLGLLVMYCFCLLNLRVQNIHVTSKKRKGLGADPGPHAVFEETHILGLANPIKLT